MNELPVTQLNMEDMGEEDDVLIGEGPSLDRPMTSLEKLHIIVGYALRRPLIRYTKLYMFFRN